MVITKNIIKELRGLEARKNRKASGTFLAEGNKVVCDLMEAFKCRRLVATTEWLTAHHVNSALWIDADVYEIKEAEMDRVSLLPSAPDVVAEFNIPTESEASPEGLTIMLDDVQDPGNVGTIIRTADWFGIHDIWCSKGTADCFSPKVVQSTMGALARVNVHYFNNTDQKLQWLSSQRDKGVQLLGTFMNGENLYTMKMDTSEMPAILVMGNEGKGITDEVATQITRRVTIPAFAEQHVESLNVGIATAICISQLKGADYKITH